MKLQTLFEKLIDIALDRDYTLTITPRAQTQTFSWSPEGKSFNLSLLPNFEITVLMFAHEVGHLMTWAHIVDEPWAAYSDPIHRYKYESLAWDWALAFFHYNNTPLSREAEDAVLTCLNSYDPNVSRYLKMQDCETMIVNSLKPNRKNWS